MTNRELLEQAAKAAGMRCIEYTNDYDGSMGLMQCDEHGRHTYTWNPLTNDGDALRLTVQLKIDIDFDSETANLNTVFAEQWGSACAASEYLLGDPYAATRRAIVRAAAEIAKALP